MKDLIKALQIFLKYCDPDNKWPTHCEHDELWIISVDPKDVSEEDKIQLEELGFFEDDVEDCFKSFRFGSA